jgi:hypothetical protein
MGDVIEFRKRKPGERARGKTLCREGFHKWEISQRLPFDVKLGKLLTLYKCTRCEATKTEAR